MISVNIWPNYPSKKKIVVSEKADSRTVGRLKRAMRTFCLHFLFHQPSIHDAVLPALKDRLAETALTAGLEIQVNSLCYSSFILTQNFRPKWSSW